MASRAANRRYIAICDNYFLSRVVKKNVFYVAKYPPASIHIPRVTEFIGIFLSEKFVVLCIPIYIRA